MTRSAGALSATVVLDQHRKQSRRMRCASSEHGLGQSAGNLPSAAGTSVLLCEQVVHSCGYEEISLSQSCNTLFLYNSVLVVPNVLTKAECQLLMDAADLGVASGACKGRGQGSLETWFWRFVALYGSLVTSEESWVAPLDRLPICELGSEAQDLSATILRDRVLNFLEQALPSAAQKLFGQSAGLADMSFSFSQYEPAVNRYTAGGMFDAHVDGYSVTVNVLLSEPTAFEGGGTAFWEQDCPAGHAPKIVLHPPQGSAVIFNGALSHEGRPVTSGTRHLYVASFNLDRPDATLAAVARVA